MQTLKVTREKVIALAQTMPLEKLARWYEYGVFIQTHFLSIATTEATSDSESELWQEIANWEAASDEDWLKLETKLTEEN